MDQNTARAWKTYEAKHYALYGVSVCDNFTANFVKGEATIPRSSASRRLRFDAGEREENFRNYGLEKSNVKVRLHLVFSPHD